MGNLIVEKGGTNCAIGRHRLIYLFMLLFFLFSILAAESMAQEPGPVPGDNLELAPSSWSDFDWSGPYRVAGITLSFSGGSPCYTVHLSYAGLVVTSFYYCATDLSTSATVGVYRDALASQDFVYIHSSGGTLDSGGTLVYLHVGYDPSLLGRPLP